MRGLRPVLERRRLTLVAPQRANMRYPFPDDLRQRLTGSRVIDVTRRAKYGIVTTDRDDAMIFHLGMSGRWRLDPADLGAHDHLLLETDAGRRLTLNDPRRFGFVALVPLPALSAWPAFASLGPEPFDAGFTGAYLQGVFAGRKAPVKLLLLDQRIVAGLGNIYVCEALNRAGIAPSRAAGNIALGRLDRLVDDVRTVLNAAIEAGGSTLRDYARPDGQLGYFAKQWRVYGREGQACPCGDTVKRRAEGGRSTFYCPGCQR